MGGGVVKKPPEHPAQLAPKSPAGRTAVFDLRATSGRLHRSSQYPFVVKRRWWVQGRPKKHLARSWSSQGRASLLETARQRPLRPRVGPAPERRREQGRPTPPSFARQQVFARAPNQPQRGSTAAGQGINSQSIIGVAVLEEEDARQQGDHCQPTARPVEYISQSREHRSCARWCPQPNSDERRLYWRRRCNPRSSPPAPSPVPDFPA